MPRRRVLIMGAAGRDFHNFNVAFRDDSTDEIVGFTAFQIPNISGRTYPPELSGSLYPHGIPIWPETDLADLISEHRIQEVILAYSDLSYSDVMHKAALANACGADFRLMGADATMLRSSKPVVSVGAVRTGVGKSQTSRRLAEILSELGLQTVVVRHPMPYGDLAAQRCQRFARLDDLDRHHCTIEEREEYEAHLQLQHVVYAGVDYGEILEKAEMEADLILWDGGNNDLPFYRPDLHLVMVDPLRPGHEIGYYPGEANLRLADVVMVAKIGTARPQDIDTVLRNAHRLAPSAQVLKADSVVTVASPELVEGKRVLVVEDGPTLTHGGMEFGAGVVAARKYGAAEIVDPRPHAVGTIRDTLAEFPHLSNVLPAMGYGEQQVEELKETIRRVPCDLVLVGTPINLARLLGDVRPMLRVSYELDEAASHALRRIVQTFIEEKVGQSAVSSR